MVKSSVKWIVCRSNSIGDPLVCYENACLIRSGVIGGQRAGLKSGCKKWLLKSLYSQRLCQMFNLQCKQHRRPRVS